MEGAKLVLDILSAVAYDIGIIMNNFDRGRSGRYPVFTSAQGKRLVEIKSDQPNPPKEKTRVIGFR